MDRDTGVEQGHRRWTGTQEMDRYTGDEQEHRRWTGTQEMNRDTGDEQDHRRCNCVLIIFFTAEFVFVVTMHFLGQLN